MAAEWCLRVVIRGVISMCMCVCVYIIVFCWVCLGVISVS